MKIKKLFIVFLVFCSVVSFSQSQKLPKINFFNSSNYTIEAETTDYLVYKYSLNMIGDSPAAQEFTIRPNTLESFRENFETYFKKLNPAVTKAASDFDKEASRLFYFFTGSDITANALDFEPKAGSLSVNRNVKISIDLSSPSNSKARILYIKTEIKKIKRKHGFLFFGKNSRYEVGADTKGIIIYGNRRKAKNVIKPKWDDKQIEEINASINKLQADICDSDEKIQRLKSTNESLRQSLNIAKQESQSIRNQIRLLKENARRKLSIDWTAFQTNLNSFYSDESLLYTGSVIEINGTVKESITKLNSNKKKLNEAYLAISNAASAFSQDVKDRILIIYTKRGNTTEFSSFAELFPLKEKIDSIDIYKGLIKKAIPFSVLDQIYQDFLEKNLRLDYKKWDQPIPVGFGTIDVTTINLKVGDLETQVRTLDNAHYDKDISNNELEINKIQKQISNYNQEASKRSLERPENNFIVKDVQFEFNEGYLENVVVFGEVGDSEFTCSNGEKKYITSSGGKLKFVNTSPIGFSRKMDYSRLQNEKLYSIGGDSKISYTLNLKELIPTYLEELEVDRRDFSPKNQKKRVQFDEGEKLKIIELKKLETKKLFEARIYSDFLGFADQKNPNGIIQTEVEKRLNLVTHRNQWSWFRYNRINSGALEYVEPGLTISKIEANNKSLLLNSTDKIIAGAYVPIKYTSTLELRRHEKFSAGFDLNLFLLDVTGIKSTFRLNTGIRYGLVSIIDSTKTLNNQGVLVKNPIGTTFDVGTYRFYPKFIWEVLTDERLAFKITYSYNWYFARSNYFQQVSNIEDFKINEMFGNSIQGYNNFQFLTTFQPNGKTDNKLFFRLNHFWQQGFWNTTFDQIQVGYSFFITSQIKSPSND